MLIVRPLGPGAAAYYLRGRAEAEEGRWIGAACAELGLAGAVEAPLLSAVLEGRHPTRGTFLPDTRPARRRAGWDLLLAAPKSVSLLAALAPSPEDAPTITSAHSLAVLGAFEVLEQELVRLRRSAAPGGRILPLGLVAAGFTHLTNAAGEPHLHTHLLLANLGRGPDGRWSALSDWWPARRAIAASYQLGLRHHLNARGLHLEWAPRPDGLADLTGVPTAAVAAASSRQAAARAEAASFLVSSAGRPRPAARWSAGTRTRAEAGRPDWRARAAAAGFSSQEASLLLEGARARPWKELPARTLEAHVGSWLANRGSTFALADVLVARSATDPAGAPAGQAFSWARRYAAGAERAPGGLFVAKGAQELDERTAAVGLVRRGAGVGVVPPALAAAALGSRTGLPAQAASALERLLCEGNGVEVLAAPPGAGGLLSHARLLALAKTAWESVGYRVGLATPSEADAWRWHALGAAARPSSETPDCEVLVVDQADRLPPAELLSTLEAARRASTKVVLLEGGTRARLSRPRNRGLDFLGMRLGRLDPGPPPQWTTSLEPALRAGAAALLPTAAGAAGELVGIWDSLHKADHPAWLVGLGAPEADALNEAARQALAARGRLEGPELATKDRSFRAGDLVLACRGLSMPAGVVGRVVSVNERKAVLEVEWPGSRVALTRPQAARLRHAYAVTPALLDKLHGPLLVLGSPASLESHRGRALAWAWASSGLSFTRGNQASLALADLAPGLAQGSPQLREPPERSRRAGLGIGLGLG